MRFTDVQLVTSSFATIPAKQVNTVIGQTERTDIPIPYGAANCTPGSLPELRPATVVAHVDTGSGQPRRVVFELPHPDPLLARLLRDECSQFLVEQTASIAFGEEWTEKGSGKDAVMHAVLVVSRRGPGELELHEVGATSHYSVRVADDPPGVLPAGSQRLEVPVRLTPSRCDGHSFGEAKKAFMFPVRASLDGGEVHVVIVMPPKPVQDRLIRYAQRACGLGG